MRLFQALVLTLTLFATPLSAQAQQAGLDIDDRIAGLEPGGPEFRAIVTAPGTPIIRY